MLYVQYVWGSSSQDCEMRAGESLAEALERQEADSFRGLLFMFSVCHILLIVQEGFRFDPRYLRTFRTLQTVKHALAPFVKAQVLPGVLPQSSSRSSQSLRAGATSQDTVGRNGPGVSSGRQGSTNNMWAVQLQFCIPASAPLWLCLCAWKNVQNRLLAVKMQWMVRGLLLHLLGAGYQNLIQEPAGLGVRRREAFGRRCKHPPRRRLGFFLRNVAHLRVWWGKGAPPALLQPPYEVLLEVNTFGGAGNGGALFALDQSRAAVFIDRASNRQGAALEEILDVLANFLRNVEGPVTQTLNLAGVSFGDMKLSCSS